MPVHSRDKKESNHEDMEVDYPENEGSSSDEEDTESSSVSEDGDTSEMDDEDCERRRMECLDEMSNLEKQFTDLKDQLYKERLNQVDAKLQEVIAGKASEYLEPLEALEDNMQIRTKVAGIYRELCLESVKNKYECEIQAARQHCESEKLLLFDTVQSELEEKIRRLEEDRHSIDITSELWNDELQSRKKKRDPFSPDKKKKPVVVSGPYIVYMLKDLDILEDWTTIRKAMATLGPHRVKAEHTLSELKGPLKIIRSSMLMTSLTIVQFWEKSSRSKTMAVVSYEDLPGKVENLEEDRSKLEPPKLLLRDVETCM
nr:PREDICTED: breast cancer metastasis-suppressor 1-like protein [Latimeria chalumnae]|eukprot:XP_005989263.1 PREDICTED: breast cancer metastasis-suppressor 1-like protein [Latimeria chalumnae]